MQPTTTSGNIITQSFIFRFGPPFDFSFKEGANKQVISSQADSLIKISRIWADFFSRKHIESAYLGYFFTI
nr:hypothetical protein [Escherichia coli]